MTTPKSTLPPGLVFRRATQRDHNAVTQLEDAMLLDGGLDYIKNMYIFYMSNHENYFFYILEEDGKVVCCAYRYVVDDGDSVVDGAGRTHPDHQGKGYMGILRTLADADLTKRLSKKPSRHIYVAFDSEFHRRRALTSPNTYTIIAIRNLIIWKATTSKIAHVVSTEGSCCLGKQPLRTEIWEPSEEEIISNLCHQLATERLFPDGCFVANAEPYKPMPSNFALASKMSKVYVNGFRETGTMNAVSWVCSVVVNAGWRFDLNFFGSKWSDFHQHLQNYLRIIAFAPTSSAAVIHLHMCIPLHMDRNAVERKFEKYGFERGIFPANLRRILMGKYCVDHKL